MARVTSASDDPPSGWDALTVSPPGGHVLQGAAWAAHRAAAGWRPRFLRFDDDRAALLLTRRQPPFPGFLAYAPRGPITAGDPAAGVAARAVALGEWVRARRGTILAVDPVLDADAAYEERLAGAGFAETEEIQPSRHRMILDLPADGDTDEAFRRLSKATRQRVRAAEKAGTAVEADETGTYLEAFGELVDAAAERKHFTFAADRGFVDWWRRVLAAGQATFRVALNDGRLLGGLLAYRQGGTLATAFSGDRAEYRRDLPGTMHLLRWRLIEEATTASLPWVDLGGVDTPGHRRLPEPGDPGHGLYEHKVGFGARWVESAAAHEIVLRPWTYRAGLAARAARRFARRR
jgi:lipid II:glycine glycyltransferase (peptidoglycan interpeptide bridge formation enzyme)